MHADTPAALSDALTEVISVVGPLPLAIGAALLVVLVVVLATARLRLRRRLGKEVRALVGAVEELRSGAGRGQTEIGSRSALGLVSDALQRLGADLHHSRVETETATERWRAVTNATRDTAIITTDTDGDVRTFSPGASALTGWDEGEILSRPAAVLFDERAYKDLLPKLTRRSLREKGVTTRSTMTRRDGTGFQAEISVRLLQGRSSRPVGFMILVRDITDQMRLEDDLRDAERRYRALVEGLTEGVVILREGKIVYVNPASEALCGLTRTELEGRAWRELVSTGDVLVMESAIGAVASGASAGQDLRCTLLGAEGEARAAVRIKAGPVEFGGAAGVVLLVQDETASRSAEAELRRNETRLDAVLEATSDGILVLADDPGRFVLMTNGAFAEMLGLRATDLLGASEDRLARLLHEAEHPAGALAERIGAGADDDTPTIISLGGEPPREIEVTQAGLIGRRGESLGRIVACRDVTERRRSERELQEQAERLQLAKVELERSYGQLNEVNYNLKSRGEELNQLNRELQHLDKMKSDLIGNVSHELQTPLVSIRGYTEMILKERLGPISEEQRKGLSLSLKNIDRLIAMIDNLLAFSRAHPELGELKLSRFDLRSLIEEVVALLDEKIGEKEQQALLRFDGSEIAIQADRDKIHQVFLNLLSNAVKFGRRGGRIEISARAGRSGYAKVAVRDDGIGIPPEAIGRIFERHFRVRRDPQVESSGSGIGLSIVRDILRLHGCTVDASSEEGQGARFSFTLPLARQESSEPTESGEGGPAASEPAVGGEPGKGPAEPGPGSAAAAPPDGPEDPSTESPPRLRIIRRHKSEG